MRHSVIVLDGLLKSRELENINYWSENLFIHDLSIRANLNDCWLNVVSWSRNLLSTCQDAASLRFNLLKALQVVTNTVLAVHRAHESVSGHWVSNRDILVGLDHARHKSIINGLVEVDSAQGRAPLTTGTDRCKHCALEGEL